MIVQVKLFAVAKEIAGADSIEIEVAEDATIADLRARCAAKHPDLSVVLQHAMFAVNTDYADDQTQLSPNAEVACIPPVSGG